MLYKAEELPLLCSHYTHQIGDTYYFGMEDLLTGYLHPSIVDLKIGFEAYPPEIDEHKRARAAAKYPWRRDTGFLLTGMKVDCLYIIAAFISLSLLCILSLFVACLIDLIEPQNFNIFLINELSIHKRLYNCMMMLSSFYLGK
ncbi:unnamed protein product [Protopolystoma xenopodis]|uniref:Kinase n=1 Tax=Protopolystoma xenopodis TaxID=117903 RepID=A0A448WQK7_9PLAT|nr:unnamed protein product [Protopolystoma xenopodis]